jgi:hypothetical protein
MEVLKHVQKNWKTTASSILTAFIGLSAAAVAPNPWISTILAAKILGASTIAKVILGLIQKDGGSQLNVSLPPGTQLHQDTTIQTPTQEMRKP